MAGYLNFINEKLAAEIEKIPDVIVLGENIDTGSKLSGLAKNITPHDTGVLINTGNCEYTHCGMGLGVMLNGGTVILMVKQLDFMLLGMDHFVSTYQDICASYKISDLGSFTIVVVVCDHGFQGPQSSFNALGDICSAARAPGFTLTNSKDSSQLVASQLRQPGFRFLALSQRHSPGQILDPDLARVSKDFSVFQYSTGDFVTIACFNFSMPEGWKLCETLESRGLTASLFSVNQVYPVNWSDIITSVEKTGRLVVMDDSKSHNLLGYKLLHEVSEALPSSQRMIIKREEVLDYSVGEDKFNVQYEDIIRRLKNI